MALGVVDKPRVEWDAADLCYRGFKIEVKSSADCQSWRQEKPSTIQFSIRNAGHFPERDKTKANVLDVPALYFYVVSTAALNREFGETKSLSLATVRRLGMRCKFGELRAAVEQVLREG